MTRGGLSKHAVYVILPLLLTVPLFPAGCAQRLEVGVGNEPGYRGDRPAERHGPPPWAPAHGYRAKHRYRYYPASEVYYDQGRGVYFYYRSGAWRVSVSLPRGVHIRAEDYVTLKMNTDKPHEYHSEVKRHYPPGQLKQKDKKDKARGRGKGPGN